MDRRTFNKLTALAAIGTMSKDMVLKAQEALLKKHIEPDTRQQNEGTAVLRAGSYRHKYRHLDIRYEFADSAASQRCIKPMLSFNRGARRDPLLLITGDKPAFALMMTQRDDSLDPDLLKLGDGCFFLNGVSLQDVSAVDALFEPVGSVWKGSFEGHFSWELSTALLANRGQCSELRISNSDSLPRRLTVQCSYGGLRRCGRPFAAPYFEPDPSDGHSNIIRVENQVALFHEPNILGVAVGAFIERVEPQLKNGRVYWEFSFDLQPKESWTTSLVVAWGRSEQEVLAFAAQDGFDQLASETKQYYEAILASATIQTPNQLIDQGFQAGLLNLDYVYAKPAWFEGGHWWSAYWCNNYQISAAIGIGSVERATEALKFFSIIPPGGPYPVVSAAGKCAGQPTRDLTNDPLAGYEDGIPYYLYQLLQYYEHTNDFSLFESMWEPLARSTDRLLTVRDSNGDGLIDWHFSSNATLYQADHLGMPGNAASTSLIMAGMLDRMASVAAGHGHSEDSQRWKQRSISMREKLLSELWNPQEGCFGGHEDHQGVNHPPHYYTDLCFPALYGALPEEYSWLSLQWLAAHLWSADSAGQKRLMRVGNMKPSCFGNDNVMPTQMAEAARAYFAIGETDRGLALLESVALAATVYTDSPGSFPERMSDDGQGLANYLFGNPTGSFVYAVVRGLFGLELQDGGQTLFWCPGFPLGWPEAKLKVNYAEVSFQRISDANDEHIDFVATNPSPRKLRFRLLINNKRVSQIQMNGLPLHSYTETAAIGGTWISLETPPLLQVKLRIEIEDRVIEPIEVHAEADSTLSLQLPGAIETWHDWQQSAQKVKCSASTLELTVTSRPGTYYLGVKCKQIPVVIPARMIVSAKAPPREVSEKYNVAGLKRIVPLESFRNASTMLVRSR